MATFNLSMEMQKKKEQEVGSLLKSLLTSFGGKLPMNKLNVEYKTVVGMDIPYREFKYPTLAKFLQSIPNILSLETRGPQVFVNVVVDKNIGLILRHVREQKPTAVKAKKTKPVSFAPRHLHSQPVPCAARHHPQPVPYAPKRPNPYPAVGAQYSCYNFIGRYNNVNGKNGKNHTAITTQGTARPNTQEINKTQGTARPNTQGTTKANTQGPARPNANGIATVTTRRLPQASTPGITTATQNGINTPKQAQNQRRLFHPAQTTRPKPQATKAGEKTFKQQLVEAVQTFGDPSLMPSFKTVRFGKKKIEWCTAIKIGDLLTVSGYPIFMKTQKEAENIASQKALQELPQVAKKRQAAQHYVTTDEDVSITRVKKILEDKFPVKRCWWEAVQSMYWDLHQEKLPQDWITKVKAKNNTGLEFDNPCVDLWTIALAQKSPRSGSMTPEPLDLSINSGSMTPEPLDISINPGSMTPELVDSSTNTSPRTPDLLDTSRTSGQDEPHSEDEDRKSGIGEKMQLPLLSLPPTPTWDVFITYVKDHNDIHLRLVGEEYSDSFDELMSEMELYYGEKKQLQPVKEPTVGDIYAARHEESWFRVEVVETQGEKVCVKFVDEGDSSIIRVGDLYHLDERFFLLPPQDLHCCLAGLEDAPREATSRAFLECVPTGQALVARVQRRQEPCALVFFDTSTNEDVNLNNKVFESLVQHLSEPSLPPVGCVTKVYLTYASLKGIIYFQEDSDTLTTLYDLLKITSRRVKEMDLEVNVDLTKLYLAYFSGDGEWYRAAPKSPVDVDGKVLMEFVDFGNIEKVCINNIRNFEALNPLLAKLPHQALLCRLYKVPTNPDLRWTVKTCQRLVELTSEDTPLLLKVVSQGTGSQLPTVQLFKRLLPQNELVSINDTLGIDTKLFSQEDDPNNNTDEDVVLCHARSLQTPCASDASQPSECGPVGSDSFLACPSMSLSDIPDVGSYFDVIVTFAASPHLFAVQPFHMSKEFGELSDNMQKHYNNPATHRQVLEIKGGQYCALKHKDNIWYRAKVEMVQKETIAGVFVDFGDRFVCSLQKVQPLLPSFCILPCLAIKAKLNGIEPVNKSWSPEDALHFRSLTANKNLSSVVYDKSVDKNNCLVLLLLLIDTSDKAADLYINQLLVEENRAIYTWA